MWDGFKKNEAKKKNKKQKLIPRVPFVWHSGKRRFPECQEYGSRGRSLSAHLIWPAHLFQPAQLKETLANKS
jgi:hypothetical protein